MTLGSHQKTVGDSQSWVTPRFILKALGSFDLDPAAANPRPWECAKVNWTEAEDGLSRVWFGRVFLNPPFNRYVVGEWVARLAAHGDGILLIHARTEAAWFEPIWDCAGGILFLGDRLHFHYPNGKRCPANSGAPAVLAAFGERNVEALRMSGLAGILVESWTPVVRPAQKRWPDMLARSPLITGFPAGYVGPLVEDGLFAGMPKNYAGALSLDPPVGFQTRSAKGQGRSPSKHYNCMSVTDVIALGPQIGELCAPHCAMFVWWPNPHLRKLDEFLGACGFTYRSTGFVWAKLRPTWSESDLRFTPDDFPIGPGYGTRKQVEIAWRAMRGAPKRQNAGVRELLFAPRREHSRKPDKVYGLIEQLYPGPYVELFARQHVPGWISWGEEVGKFEFKRGL